MSLDTSNELDLTVDTQGTKTTYNISTRTWRPFTYNHYFFSSVPGLSSSSSSAAPPTAAPPLATNPEPSSLDWATVAGDGAQLSSDDGDSEPTEDNDAAACHYSDRHPQPAGVKNPAAKTA